MNRTLLIVVISTLIVVAGVWSILRVGNRLHPVDDLQGTWQSSNTVSATQTLRIHQSGRYFEIIWTDGVVYRMELASRSPAAPQPWQTITLSGEGTHLQINRVNEQISFALNDAPPLTLHRLTRSTELPAALQETSTHPLLTLLIQIVLILALSHVIGFLFARIGQPQVMGEMVAGILLGPSLFGLVAPEWSQTIFPADSIVYLDMLSQVGVVFFLFLIGLELDPRLLRSRGSSAITISHISIITPFILGAGMMHYLYPRLFNDVHSMRFTAVALFMGAAMSITAFPVLARILTERDLQKSKLGIIAITSAAIGDVTAWCMLAFVVAVANAQGMQSAIITAVASVIYLLVMFLIVRPLLKRLEIVYDRNARLPRGLLAVIVLLTLLSAYVTERIGIHALFGAFVMGAIMPKGTGFVRNISQRLEDFVVVLLLPIFFAYTGLKTQIGLLNNASLWWDALLIVGVASVGKFGGSAIAAASSGLTWRESGAIGALMNTRGLMELVIINIGRELGVITDAVFAMMVIMALATTALAIPILDWIYPARLLRREKLPRPEPAAGTQIILIPISLPRSATPLLRLADLLAGPRKLSRRITALNLRRTTEYDAYRSLEEDIDPQTVEPLRQLLEQARQLDIDVEPIAAVAHDVPRQIVRVADEQRTDLILMGFHKPIIGNALLGGTVYRVLSAAGKNVAVFVDRGLHDIKNILVPYMGGQHDRFALQQAQRIAATSGATVTVLQVEMPAATAQPPPTDLNQQIQNNITAAGSATSNAPQPIVRLVQNDQPVNSVLKEAPKHDLIVIGATSEWGIASQLFGWRSERIAHDSPTSLLIVHQAEQGQAPLPQ